MGGLNRVSLAKAACLLKSDLVSGRVLELSAEHVRLHLFNVRRFTTETTLRRPQQRVQYRGVFLLLRFIDRAQVRIDC